MALDTRDKRAAAVNVLSPWRGILPLPDPQAEDQGDRQHVAFMARSVLAGPEGGPLPSRAGNWIAWSTVAPIRVWRVP